MTLQTEIEKIYDKPKAELTAEDLNHINQSLKMLDQGELQVVEQKNSEWLIHAWVKKAILLYFKTQKMTAMGSGEFTFFDKIPLKKWTGSEGVRVVPQALARYGSYIESGAILMPSYINIGAFVGSGSLIDTWATVGSCAYVGKNVHLSGGVGLGGVLEPPQADPVIIEDNAFIGSRCIIVEGVRVKKGAVLGAGVTLTKSTPILDVTGPVETVLKGEVPENAVIIPGTRIKKFPAGDYSLPCALMIGKRTPSTDTKTSLNDVLRDFELSV